MYICRTTRNRSSSFDIADVTRLERIEEYLNTLQESMDDNKKAANSYINELIRDIHEYLDSCNDFAKRQLLEKLLGYAHAALDLPSQFDLVDSTAYKRIVEDVNQVLDQTEDYTQEESFATQLLWIVSQCSRVLECMVCSCGSHYVLTSGRI